MASVFITGSADGLGMLAARLLVGQGHAVTLHARTPRRALDARAAVPGAAGVVVGDLGSLAGCRAVASQADEQGAFDAVIHNAALGYREPRRVETEDCLPQVFAVNTLAPYVLAALMRRPKRLVWLSSGLHREGDTTLVDLEWKGRPWDGYQAYADSKLHDAILSCAFARLWPQVHSNALEPGWVATRMGGPGAPDDLEAAPVTQAWLAVSDDPAAHVSGQYFYHLKPRASASATRDIDVQLRLLAECERMSGVELPR